jgi:DNA replication licensing factor MCM7
MARSKRPTVPPEVSSYIVDSYVRLRKQAKSDEHQNNTYTSARTLLAVLRLSQALSRLRMVDLVEIADVDEALRLMQASKESLIDDEEKAGEADQSPTSKIFRLITSMRKSSRPKRLGKKRRGANDMDVDDDDDDDDDYAEGGLSMVDIRARVTAQGFTEAQLMATIQQVGSYLLTSVGWELMELALV